MPTPLLRASLVLALIPFLPTEARATVMTLTAGDTLVIWFTTNPEEWTEPPDYLVLSGGFLGYSTATGLTLQSARLYDGDLLLGTHTSTHIENYFSYAGAEDFIGFPDAVDVNFSSILAGTIDGRLEYQLATGSMQIDLPINGLNFDTKLLLYEVLSANGASGSSRHITITGAEVVAATVPEPGTSILLALGLLGTLSRRVWAGRSSQR